MAEKASGDCTVAHRAADADNIAKLVSDAFNEIVYADDAQVASLIVQKRYGPLAGVTVTVAPLDEGSAQ